MIDVAVNAMPKFVAPKPARKRDFADINADLVTAQLNGDEDGEARARAEIKALCDVAQEKARAEAEAIRVDAIAELKRDPDSLLKAAHRGEWRRVANLLTAWGDDAWAMKLRERCLSEGRVSSAFRHGSLSGVYRGHFVSDLLEFLGEKGGDL